MSQQQDKETPKKECFFYFRYQMKLQFIPYVQEEIEHFIDLCEDQINEDGAWESIIVVLNKRVKDIDCFFNKNWSDYRAQQILRSRKLLIDFCKKYHQRFTKIPSLQESTNVKTSIASKQQKTSIAYKQQQTPISKMSLSNQKQQIKVVEQPSFIKNKSNDRNKISREKLPQTKVINPTLTPRNQKAKLVPESSIRRSDLNQVKGLPKYSNDKSRLSSASSDNIKITPISNISSKPAIKKDVYNKKLTKQEYIAYLRNKNSQI